MMRQTYKVEFHVTMDLADAHEVREKVSKQVSWRKAINAMFRDVFGVEVDVDHSEWRAHGEAFPEDGHIVRCITCRQDTPIKAMVGAECSLCAGTAVGV